MNIIGFSKKFTLLTQEAHLTKNTILSSFDLLLKANFFQDKEGYFYSSFFHLTIGLERLMKLLIVSDYMLNNNYKTPTEGYLKDKFGHKIDILYKKIADIANDSYSIKIELPKKDTLDFNLISFLTKYGTKTRYFNLNELSLDSSEKPPLQEWWELSLNAYRENTPYYLIERTGNGIYYSMDKDGMINNFTPFLGFDGHPLTMYDIIYRQLITSKSAPLLIWRVIEIFRPIFLLLQEIENRATDYENSNEIKEMVIPYYSDLFCFFNSSLSSIKKRKKWLEIFNT